MCVCTQSCLTLCDPIYHSLPGSSVHGIFQARLLEWVAISYSTDNAYNVLTWCQSPFLPTTWAKDTLWRALPTYSVFLHGYPLGIRSYETFLLDPVLLFPHSSLLAVLNWGFGAVPYCGGLVTETQTSSFSLLRGPTLCSLCCVHSSFFVFLMFFSLIVPFVLFSFYSTCF